MLQAIKTIFENVLYQLYSIVIWSVVLFLTYIWHLKDMINYDLTLVNAIGIIFVIKIINSMDYKMYYHEDLIDEIRTGNVNLINPYAVLLSSFIFNLVLN